jgi:ATP-binding cassette subfamily F protein uup
VRLGTNLQVAYFDQLRAQLDPERSVAATVSPTSDFVEVAGQRRHVISYLGDFLFAAQRAESPVRMLSGGERNRLLLATLFARPANVLVMDEPTNDLDIESLELLEATLQEYPGTVLLVSHDRRFLDNVVTQTLAAEGGGRWKEYVGGYSDWLEQRPAAKPATEPSPGLRPPSPRPSPALAGEGGRRPGEGSGAKPAPSKLSYKEARELAQLPALIEALETEQRELHARMASADYHRQGAAQIRADGLRVAAIETELAKAFDRWAELEARTQTTKPG